MRLNSLQISKLYKDMKYEFLDGELYKLLGEDVQPTQLDKKQQ